MSTPVSNPYADDPDRGSAYEQGFDRGYAEPTDTDEPPFTPELLDAYIEGRDAGQQQRDGDEHDRGGPPIGTDAEPADPEDAAAAGELIASASSHAVLHWLFGTTGGLAAIVGEMFLIPGDAQITPLPADWTGPSQEPDATFFACCPRDGHLQAEVGVTPDGIWVGPARTNYQDADVDRRRHPHNDASVCRFAANELTCGPVAAPQ